MCEVNTSWPIRFGLRGRGGAKGACTGELKVRLSGILDYQEFEDIEDGDFPPSSMFTGMKRWFVQELRQSDS